VMNANVANAQALVASVARLSSGSGSCGEGCRTALEGSVMTARDAWPESTRRRLATLAPRIFA